METISPQLMRLLAEISSKILRRVSSAKAFDIFSTSERSIINLECSEVIAVAAIEQNRYSARALIKLQPNTSIFI